MGIAKPAGEYAGQMLEPGGWVELDEQSLQSLTNTLRLSLNPWMGR